jgi:hypothetical protein
MKLIYSAFDLGFKTIVSVNPFRNCLKFAS